MPVIITIILFTLSSAPAYAQSITGVVRNAYTSEPLPGAHVLLESEGGSVQRSAVSDGDGRFRFADLEGSRYGITVTHLAFMTREETVDFDGADTRYIRILLFPGAVDLPEVVLTASRARKQVHPVTFSNLTARDLEERGAMRDLPVVLSELPSITYHSENGNGIGYSTLRMRGFDQRRIAVLINGIPQNDPEAHNVFWINFFDIQGATHDIQVQRGAGSSFSGPAGVGGAINILAMPYRPYAYASVHAGAGTFNTRRYTVEANSGLLSDRWVVFGRFSRLESGGYRDWSWTEFYRYFAGAVRYGERSTLTLQSYGGPQRDGLAFSGIPRNANEDAEARRFNASSLSGDTENFHQPHFQVFHDLSLGEGLALHQSLFWIKGEGYFDFGASFRSADYLRLPANWRGLTPEERALPLFLTAPDISVLFRAYLDQHQVGWMPRITRQHATGRTTVGGELRLHRSLRWGRTQEAEGLPEHVIGSGNDFRVYRFRGEKLMTSVYASHLFRPAHWAAVQGDLQVAYQFYRHFDEAFFGREFRIPYLFANPRIGVTIFPERPLSAYASAAVANREPRMKDLYDGEEAGAGFTPRFSENPDGSFDYGRALVKPEQLVNFELGGTWRTNGHSFTANAFLTLFNDEIVPSGGLDQFGVPRTGNAERTRHVGIEIEATARPARGFELSGNVTASRNTFVRFVEFELDESFQSITLDRSGNPIAGFPELIANGRAAYRGGGWMGAVSVQRAGRQFIDNSGGHLPDGSFSEALTVPAYTLLNGSAQYRFSESSPMRGLMLSLDVNNILDSKVLMYGNVGPLGPQFFPAATRNVFASVRYRIGG